MSEDWKEALGPTPECIDIARLGEELTAAERAHAETCVRCQTELALFREVMAEETSPASQWIAGKLMQGAGGRAQGAEAPAASPAPRPPRPAPWYRVLYAVAAALVILVGANWWMRYQEQSIEVDMNPGMYRSTILEVIGPDGDISQPPNELRWKPVPDATRYSVQILEVDATQIWSAATTQSQIALPREIRARFLPGKTLLWTVTAYRGNEELAVSPTQNVRVNP